MLFKVLQLNPWVTSIFKLMASKTSINIYYYNKKNWETPPSHDSTLSKSQAFDDGDSMLQDKGTNLSNKDNVWTNDCGASLKYELLYQIIRDINLLKTYFFGGKKSMWDTVGSKEAIQKERTEGDTTETSACNKHLSFCSGENL